MKMVSISPSAYQALQALSKALSIQPNPGGTYSIELEDHTYSSLKSHQKQGETLSDTILRLVGAANA